MARNCKQPLLAENSLQQAAQKIGTSVLCHKKKLNSVNNLSELRYRFFPRASGEIATTLSHLECETLGREASETTLNF